MSDVAAWLLPALVGLLLTAWVGAVTASALCPALARESRALRAALGYGVGMGVTAGQLFALGVLGVRFGVATIVGAQVAWAVGVAWLAALTSRPAGIALARAWGAGLLPFTGSDGRTTDAAPVAATDTPASVAAGAAPEEAPRGRPDSAPRTARSPLTWALLAATALVVLVVTLLSIADGASFIDARTMWMVKARAFFLDRGLDGAYFTGWPEVLDRRSYPLLYPLYGTYLHLLCGGIQDAAVKLGQGATLAALLVLVHHMLRRVTGALTSAAATLLFALCGPAVTLTVWGNADLALAFFVLAAVWSLAHASHRAGDASHDANHDAGDAGDAGAASLARVADDVGRSRSHLALTGLFLACAVFTKLEGALVVASLAVACVVTAGLRAARDPAAHPRSSWWSVASRRARFAGLGRVVVPPLVVGGAWLAFCASRDLGHYMAGAETFDAVSGDAGLLGERVAFVAGRLLDQALNERWLYAWPLFVLALALAVSRRARGRASLAVVPVFVLLQVAALFATFVLLSKHVEWHVQTAMTRLLFHVFPAAYVFTVARLAGPGAPR